MTLSTMRGFPPVGVALVALLAGGGASAEEPPAPPSRSADTATPATAGSVQAPRFGPRRAARRGDRGLLHLRDGRSMEGTLVTTSEDGDAVDLADGKRRVFPGRSVFEVEPLLSSEPWAGLREGEVRAVLYDGEVVSGRLLGREEGTLEVEVPDGSRRTLRPDAVRTIYGPSGPLPQLRSGTSPSRVRALWAQTARILDPGEMTLTWSQLLTAQVSIGARRWIMVSGGTTVPVGWAEDAGGTATVRATFGAEVRPRLHLAGGVEAWTSGIGGVISLFGAVTLGDEARWASVYFGPPPTSVQRLGSFGDRLLSISGGWGFTQRLSVVVEGWTGLQTGGSDLMLAASARFRLWGLDVDAGLLTSSEARLVPILAISGTLETP